MERSDWMFLSRLLDYTKLRAHLANSITLMNLGCGILSIVFIIQGSPHMSVIFIFLAVIFDHFDGKVARKFNTESEFGKELDSLCDLVSFGVAPAMLIYQVSLSTMPHVGLTLTVLFIICGAVRLARYNIKDFDGMFCGLPITAAGFIMALAFFLVPFVPTLFFVLLESALTVSMVSNIRVAKL